MLICPSEVLWHRPCFYYKEKVRLKHLQLKGLTQLAADFQKNHFFLGFSKTLRPHP